MTSHAQSSHQIEETQFIESLRTRYENEGYTFMAHPVPKERPKFLGSYVPDAIALKQGQNIVIEVKRRQNPSTKHALKQIRRLFDGQADWHFQVIVMGIDDPQQSVAIPSSTMEIIRGQMDEVKAMIAEGYHRTAFINAWSLLEASLRLKVGETSSRPRKPSTVVQTLAINGYIEPEMERRMRDLINLRNRVVHGDLTVEPAVSDSEFMLSAIDEVLRADQS